MSCSPAKGCCRIENRNRIENPAVYVSPAGRVKARIGYWDEGAPFPNWSAKIDLAKFHFLSQ